MGRGRSLPALVLADTDRATLQGWSRRRETAQAVALRLRIILRGASGLTATTLTSELGGLHSDGAQVVAPVLRLRSRRLAG
jgi:hypothetical protein